MHRLTRLAAVWARRRAEERHRLSLDEIDLFFAHTPSAHYNIVENKMKRTPKYIVESWRQDETMSFCGAFESYQLIAANGNAVTETREMRN